MENSGNRYDWIVIGSGFGGSVSALRLAEKGYRVLVIEKGRRFATTDFAKTNLELSRWLWAPAAGLRGIYQMTFMRHVTILHGVGVGGGSLVYANTLPRPKRPFYASKSWSHLADWEKELAPHYDKALEMLGATRYPGVTEADRILKEIAVEIGRAEHHHPTDVAVFFGKPGVEVDDPYFGGKGPKRVGCTECGACMTGCRVGAKNTLDRNYLFLAERLGVVVVPETEVTAVRPGSSGYRVETRGSFDKKQKQVYEAGNVVFAGGVMGTIPLLLAMREDPEGLPGLSARLGRSVRTNNESLTAVSNQSTALDFSTTTATSSRSATATAPTSFESSSFRIRRRRRSSAAWAPSPAPTPSTHSSGRAPSSRARTARRPSCSTCARSTRASRSPSSDFLSGGGCSPPRSTTPNRPRARTFPKRQTSRNGSPRRWAAS